MSKLTPMMQQYQAIKAEHKGTILFFRLGDFYEMFGQDAIEASRILDITLTARNKKNDPIPMCGVPYHAAENYIAKLTKAGRKVAICEQVSDPTIPGIVKRQVVRVITPGTTFSDQVLTQKANHYIVSIFPQKDYFGLAFADLTTGEFKAFEAQGFDKLAMELTRLEPSEIVIQREHYEDPDIRAQIIQLTSAPLSPCDFYEESSSFLRQHFHTTTLDGFGIASWPFAIQASGLLLRYLLDTQKDNLAHIDRIKAHHREKWMPLDEATIRNLELFSSLRDHDQKGTLLSILDKTESSMGGRLLRRWLVEPLTLRSAIEARHDAVDNIKNEDDMRHTIHSQLKNLTDLERLLGRLSSGAGNARDLLSLSNSLALIPGVQSALDHAKSRMLESMAKDLNPLDPIVKEVSEALVEEPPLKINEGGLFQMGYNQELDELNALMKDAKSALRVIEEKEREATGINSMKIKYNKVFGYYLEVSKANADKVPDRYIRKQTLVNAERYITDELKEYEDKVLHAQERATELEYELFLELRERTLEHIHEIKNNAHILAELDVLLSFARIAIERNYCRPQFTDDEMHVTNGRHPVVEDITLERSFVPNDAHFKHDLAEVKLITGPNMSGKSTYLRQVALIALMAQIGSFVPATVARLPIFDRIFTRVGASDNLVRGQSTFMVEMQEAANILNHATRKSLIILDEIGRGTSTYDGLSLAWSILEFLHDRTSAFTLFATHYHELINLAEKLEKANNYSIDVQETNKGVLFLHKIKEGGIDRSYGIEVAKLAGMPTEVTQRSEEILHSLEAQRDLERKQAQKDQMNLFTKGVHQSREKGKVTHPALEKLKGLDINSLTPVQALNTLNELKELKE